MKLTEATKAAVSKSNLPATAPVVPAAKSNAPALNPASVAALAQVQTKDEVQQSEKLQKLGVDIITQVGKVAEKYHALITYIRQAKCSPKLVSYEMGKLGFKRSRISEVKRVAFASDDTYSAYEAKLIGFDKAIELARATVDGKARELTPAARQLTAGDVLDQADIEEADDKQSSARSTPTAKKKKVSVRAQMLEHASALAGLITGNRNITSLVWNFPEMRVRITGVLLTEQQAVKAVA